MNGPELWLSTVAQGHAEPGHPVLLQGCSEIPLNMNAFSLLPLILVSVSKLTTTWLRQQMNGRAGLMGCSKEILLQQ